MGDVYCACGRAMSACDGSRIGCEAAQARWAAGYQAGAEAMRERAAAYLVAVADDDVDPDEDRLDGLDVDAVLRTMAAGIRALPLDDDAREDGGSDGE